MCDTSSKGGEKEKDEVKEDSVSEVSVADPTWSRKMTYRPISEAVEQAPVVVPARDMAGSGIQKVDMNDNDVQNLAILKNTLQPVVLKEKAAEKDLVYHQLHTTWPKAGRLQASLHGPERTLTGKWMVHLLY